MRLPFTVVLKRKGLQPPCFLYKFPSTSTPSIRHGFILRVNIDLWTSAKLRPYISLSIFTHAGAGNSPRGFVAKQPALEGLSRNPQSMKWPNIRASLKPYAETEFRESTPKGRNLILFVSQIQPVDIISDFHFGDDGISWIRKALDMGGLI